MTIATNPRRAYLQVLPRLIVGGAEQVVCDLALAVDRTRYEPIVLSLTGEGPLQSPLEEAGIEVIVHHFGRHRVSHFPQWLAEHLRLFQTVARLVRERNVAIVQTHVLGARHTWVALAARWGGAPIVVWTFHNIHFLRNGWFGLKPRVWATLFRLASAIVDNIVAVSRDVRDGLVRHAGISPDRITVINNGIDFRRYAGPTDPLAVRQSLGFGPSERLVVTVATLKAQKGHNVLLDAVPAVMTRHPTAHFLIVGDGELRAGLEAKTEQQGLEGHVHFLGARRDVPELLAASDLFVMPSLWDGLSIALLEAMAAGKPIVATDVSGVREVLTDSVTGRVVSPGNPSALASAVNALLSDTQRAAEMAGAARRRARSEYGRERVARETMELFERLYGPKRHSHGSKRSVISNW